MFYQDQFISLQQVAEYTAQGQTVDGTHGGLVMGPSHDLGGIQILMKYKDGYLCKGEMEGYEYLLNTGATLRFQSHFDVLNNAARDKLFCKFYDYKPASTITIVDASIPNTLFKAKHLLLDGRGIYLIFNKYSTMLELDILEEMNQEVSFKFSHEEQYIHATRLHSQF